MFELSWRTGPDPAAVQAVRALVDAVTEADGVAPLSEDALLHLGDAGAVVLWATAGDGELAGVATLDLSDPQTGSGELAVHPRFRRAGLGSRTVEEMLGRSPHLRLWAHGDLPGAVALAARFGFGKVRELWQLRRSLSEPVPEVRMPDGVRLRAFVVGADEAEFLRVNNAAFDWHPEQGGWDLGQVKLREAEPWFDPEGFLLAVDADDRLLGFHWTKVHPGRPPAEPPIGEVYVLGVDPSARGRRLGAALTAAGLTHLRDRGLGGVMLYVEADNTAAVRVYRDLGFTRWGTDVSYAR